jgi:hypothetical protein
MSAKRPEWLTVAQVCEELQITADEWNAWRAAGNTPLHLAMPGGQLRVRAADFDHWLDALTVPDEPPAEARTRAKADPRGHQALTATSRLSSAYICQRVRDAIDASGNRGLMRSEIWSIFSRTKTLSQFNEMIAELLASGAYEEFIRRTGEGGRPPVVYRRKVSREALGDASRATTANGRTR